MIKNKHKVALKVYLQNVEEFSNEPDLRNMGGDILLKINKKEEAVLEYERCIELFRGKKLFANAIAICKKILRINPHYEHIYAVLGDIDMDAGLIAEAVLNYLEYAERKRKTLGRTSLKDTLNKIVELFGVENKILIQSLPSFPELKREFDIFMKERESYKAVQRKDLIEMIKRDPKYADFDRLIEIELFRSRRFVRPFSIFVIELNFIERKEEKDTIDLEKICGILKNNLRTIDYVFLNTEGFFYGLLPETPSDGAFILSDRLANKLKEMFPNEVKISLRWATYPKDGQKMDTLLESLQKSGQINF